MAKGDDSRVRNAIDAENDYLGNRMDNVRFGMAEPMFNAANANFGEDRAQGKADYAAIMPGFQEFAKTGGFTPMDLSAIRARAVSPVRSIYANAGREVDRANTLAGGGLPGRAVLRARMAREMNQGLSDAAMNAEGSIAEMVQKGKLAGLSGASQLYGTTPGWSALSSRNLSDAAGLNMDLLKTDVGRGLGILGERNAAAGIPGKFEKSLGIAGSFVKNIGEGVKGAVSPWAGG